MCFSLDGLVMVCYLQQYCDCKPRFTAMIRLWYIENLKFWCLSYFLFVLILLTATTGYDCGKCWCFGIYMPTYVVALFRPFLSGWIRFGGYCSLIWSIMMSRILSKCWTLIYFNFCLFPMLSRFCCAYIVKCTLERLNSVGLCLLYIIYIKWSIGLRFLWLIFNE